MTEVPAHLRSIVELVQLAYPNGISADERSALLVALCDRLGEENLGLTMWAVAGDEPVVAQNDAAAAMTTARPEPRLIEEARQRLRDAAHREQPLDYTPPTVVWLVELTDETGDECFGQVGGFTTQQAADEVLALLQAEGRTVRLNAVPVHLLPTDWEYDR